VQIRLLPVADEFNDYCYELKKIFDNAGIRCEVDPGRERLGKMVRTAEKEKIPLLGVVGGDEQAKNGVTIRSRKLGDLGLFGAEELAELVKRAIGDAVEMEAVGEKKEKNPDQNAEI